MHPCIPCTIHSDDPFVCLFAPSTASIPVPRLNRRIRISHQPVLSTRLLQRGRSRLPLLRVQLPAQLAGALRPLCSLLRHVGRQPSATHRTRCRMRVVCGQRSLAQHGRRPALTARPSPSSGCGGKGYAPQLRGRRPLLRRRARRRCRGCRPAGLGCVRGPGSGCGRGRRRAWVVEARCRARGLGLRSGCRFCSACRRGCPFSTCVGKREEGGPWVRDGPLRLRLRLRR